MNTKIFSVFPACGKTWLFDNQTELGLNILDSDSSKFSWVYTDDGNNGFRRERNPDFPMNYIRHIKESIGKCDYIFISSHTVVRDALDKTGIDFTIVYPEAGCMAEWVGRCFIRDKNGEDGCGADLMYQNWEQWIQECVTTGATHNEIVLKSKEHLSDYISGKGE